MRPIYDRPALDGEISRYFREDAPQPVRDMIKGKKKGELATESACREMETAHYDAARRIADRIGQNASLVRETDSHCI
jgi:hypothetical protein